MKKFSLKEILSISLDVGERMLKCGAEVSRVEKTITIICESYGVKYREVFAMNSLIVATLRDDRDSVTESRRIAYHENDLGQLERLNDLSRSICKKNVSRKIVLSRIDECKKRKNSKLIILGQVLAASSFTLFFGGNLKDSLVSGFIAIVIFFLNLYASKNKINDLIINFMSSFVIGIISILFTKINIGNNYDKIIIGDIMLLIPGLSMFISIDDIFKGDILSGLGRFTEGIFLALTIAAGVGLSLLIGGTLWLNYYGRC